MGTAYTNSLAYIKAKCYLDKKYKECNGVCRNCDTYKRLAHCYSGLSDYEKLSVDATAKSYIGYYDLAYRKRRGDVIFKRVCKLLAVACLCFFLVLKCRPKTESNPTALKTDERICTVLKATQRMVRDTNSDDKINCVDYAVTFKLEWDNRYNDYECEIVRNKNDNTHWHHLFVRVKSGDTWLYVEPQGTCESYNIKNYWKDKYDSKYNVYGETELWLTKGYL